jgi:hypothetical protein
LGADFDGGLDSVATSIDHRGVIFFLSYFFYLLLACILWLLLDVIYLHDINIFILLKNYSLFQISYCGFACNEYMLVYRFTRLR